MAECKKQGGAGAIVFTVVAMLLPLLYVLSIGPAVAVLPLTAVNFIYYPLAVLCHYVSPFKIALEWYLGLWN